MNGDNHPHDIFISYSRKNKDAVLPIKDEIEQLGLTCWIDLSDIPCGADSFKKRVIPGIRQTRVAFLFFLSAESQSSEYAMKEINFAKKRAKKRVVLVRFNDDEMTDEFYFDFQDADIIDWRAPEQKEKLLRDLRAWSGNGGLSPVAPSAAAPTLVVCPVCGKKNDPRETFKCRACKRDNLCLRHQDESTFLCFECATAQRKARRRFVAILKVHERAVCEEAERRQLNQVVCPACGSRNLSNCTFTCRICGKKHLCQKHYDAAENCCTECAVARRKSREEALREAREEVRRKMREKPPSKGPVHVAGALKTLILPGGAEMEMIYCPPGEFMMGSPISEGGRGNGETQHRVRLTKGFWLGKYPVTQGQWQSVMGSNPSHFNGEEKVYEKGMLFWKKTLKTEAFDSTNYPVENISWKYCQAFITKVNAVLRCGARLPTEAEWEYACRAGASGAYGGTGKLDEMGWFSDNSVSTTHPVGQKKANAWGFCDMHGNVWEWCSDWYGDYPPGSVLDPQGPTSGSSRVLRGGDWNSGARICRSASRDCNFFYPGFLIGSRGFRLCCSALPNDDQ